MNQTDSTDRDRIRGPFNEGAESLELGNVDVRNLGPDDESVVQSALTLFDSRAEATPQDFLADPGTFALVAERNGEVVGWIYGYELPLPDGRREAMLYSIDVAEKHRGRGVGRTLTRAFLEEAQRRGCTEVWTLTDDDNATAQSLYHNTGGGTGKGQLMYQWEPATE